MGVNFVWLENCRTLNYKYSATVINVVREITEFILYLIGLKKYFPLYHSKLVSGPQTRLNKFKRTYWDSAAGEC